MFLLRRDGVSHAAKRQTECVSSREIPLAVVHLRPLSAEAHHSAGRRGKVNSGFMFVGVLQCFGGGGVGCWRRRRFITEHSNDARARLGSARLISAGDPKEKKRGRKKPKGMKRR